MITEWFFLFVQSSIVFILFRFCFTIICRQIENLSEEVIQVKDEHRETQRLVTELLMIIEKNSI
jgi:hypothetical protein